MPTTTPPIDPKSRQSSGGRSFFGRKLTKERPTESRIYDEGVPFGDSLGSGTNSANGSKSSRHSHRPSVASLDMDAGVEGHALQLTSGVITSIPYDSLSTNSKTPIPVDYLPRHDQVPVRRDPLPHHLNKGGGDFHQYPSWTPDQAHTQPRNTMNGSSHPTGPRPPAHTLASSTRDRPLPGRPSTSATMANGSQNSYSTGESSNARNSFDQTSVHSTNSSITRGSSTFSSDYSSRTAVPSHIHDTLRPGSSHSSSRQSTASHAGWSSQHSPSFHSATSFNPDGFHLPRPNDDTVIEAQFVDLMHKRGWQNLPDQARRQMMAYPAAKKWTLVHQDKLTEWQGEQKRRTQARQTLGASDGTAGILMRADEEGSPEWYVRRVMDDTITAKQLQSLSVSLRTQPIR